MDLVSLMERKSPCWESHWDSFAGVSLVLDQVSLTQIIIPYRNNIRKLMQKRMELLSVMGCWPFCLPQQLFDGPVYISAGG